ncbi:hypothetical protein [Herbaspirillum sp. CAH-3]|uniref:hypothetical protein n=1 Tax=Herbaspirillum sp. CAH-3 TaxID=2605746 RepID=UPI001E562B9C|nr:hypothetical protein [Herbaspirillum sp. CAH-3]
MANYRIVLRAVVGTFLAGMVGVAASQTPALLLFGGHSHDKFLGCLNCSEHDNGSVCNEYGSYGSGYNSDSIWNSYGQYGSSYSSLSPWNSYASDPPVIVDRNGRFYGYLTANASRPKRTEIKGLVALTDAAEKFDDLDKLREAFCEK